MARLTYKNGFGRWAFLLIGREITGNAANKLAEYENMGDPSEMQPIKRGEWIGSGDGYADGEIVLDIWECSNCGTVMDDWDEKPNYKFCPCCGADMRSDEERTAANET